MAVLGLRQGHSHVERGGQPCLALLLGLDRAGVLLLGILEPPQGLGLPLARIQACAAASAAQNPP